MNFSTILSKWPLCITNEETPPNQSATKCKVLNQILISGCSEVHDNNLGLNIEHEMKMRIKFWKLIKIEHDLKLWINFWNLQLSICFSLKIQWSVDWSETKCTEWVHWWTITQCNALQQIFQRSRPKRKEHIMIWSMQELLLHYKSIKILLKIFQCNNNSHGSNAPGMEKHHQDARSTNYV